MALRGIMRTITARPARELGPRMPQRKYLQEICPGFALIGPCYYVTVLSLVQLSFMP